MCFGKCVRGHACVCSVKKSGEGRMNELCVGMSSLQRTLGMPDRGPMQQDALATLGPCKAFEDNNKAVLLAEPVSRVSSKVQTSSRMSTIAMQAMSHSNRNTLPPVPTVSPPNHTNSLLCPKGLLRRLHGVHRLRLSGLPSNLHD